MILRAELRADGRRRPIVGQRGLRKRGERSRIEPVDLPRALVRTEEKEFVLLDRAAAGDAVLILLEIGFRLAVYILKKRVGVENVVPHELPERAMEVVGARFRNQV